MTLAEEETTPESRVSKDDLASLILSTTDIEIEGIGRPFGIRALTWKEDADIDLAVISMSFPGAKTDRDLKNMRARERMRLIVQATVTDPRLEKSDVLNMPVGLVMRLAREIDKLSSYLPKK